MSLPPPRGAGRYSVALVCLGNICRSPTADVVLNARLVETGLDDRVTVVSSGTGDWHVGNPMDRRAAAVLTEAGYDASRHRARQYDAGVADSFDLILAMDHDNLTDLGGPSERIRLFRDFDPAAPGTDVPDPYYGGPNGFAEVLQIVERTASTLAHELADIV